MDARTSRYHEVYARWQRDPEGFWGEAAQEIDWIEPAKRVFDPDAGIYGRWFVGGVCNTCWNAVDRHVLAGRGEQAAIIYDSPLAGQKRTLTYHALQVETPDKTYFGAESAERRGGTVTTFNNGVYTACEPCEDNPGKAPIWRVKARKIIWNSEEKTIRFERAALHGPRRKFSESQFIVQLAKRPADFAPLMARQIGRGAGARRNDRELRAIITCGSQFVGSQ